MVNLAKKYANKKFSKEDQELCFFSFFASEMNLAYFKCAIMMEVLQIFLSLWCDILQV